MKMVSKVFLAAFCFESTQASVAQSAANPIRRVVSMLQDMQRKVTEEGEKEKELFEKFECYCKSGRSDLSSSISDAEARGVQLSSDVKQAQEKKVATEEALKSAQEDRSAAEQAMKEASAVRENEAAEFAAAESELKTNVAAISKAVTALEKGVAGGFLQTRSAAIVRKAVAGIKDMDDDSRQTLLAFLSATDSSQYAPQSGQITGILKEIGDEMSRNLADVTNQENSAIQSFTELMAAKKKEKAALSASIETKLGRIGELGVAVASMQNEAGDAVQSLAADQAFLAELEKGCETKAKEWEERQKVRAQELVALADTIRVLNDDDALDLFKKTLPSASASFVQVQSRTESLRTKAFAVLRQAMAKADAPHRAGLDLISLALHGKKIGFEQVIHMVDGMVQTLKTEQADDDHKREYCGTQLDLSDDKRKAWERKVDDQDKALAAAQDAIATLSDEISSLKSGVLKLDKSVAEATENRKEEHLEFTQLQAEHSAAKELLAYAKNRLNKFYNPKLFKAAPKRELSREDRIAVSMGGTPPPTAAPGGIAGTGVAVLAQVSSHVQLRDSPAPPPSTWGAYGKKDQGSNGVMAMIDLLVQDLDKELTTATTAEHDAQADYTQLMQDSADKRKADTTALQDAEGARADAEAAAEGHAEGKEASGRELMATNKYISSLHAECDWLLKYFDARKEARSSEIDALQNAKAVLSGADFALLQTRSQGFLARAQ